MENKKEEIKNNPLLKQLGVEIESWTESLLPCHVDRDDQRYGKYLELIDLMRMPAIESILFGKLEELKILGKEVINEFFERMK